MSRITNTTAVITTIALLTSSLVIRADTTRPCYPWRLPDSQPTDTIAMRFAPPEGFHRTPAAEHSFADWLRELPLAPEGTPVRLYDGSLKWSQEAQAAVVDMDVGSRNLQQCADAVMRLRAEYLHATGQDGRICFRFSDGSAASWSKWSQGYRPDLTKKPATWSRTAKPSSTYATFRSYLTRVFQFAGTASLEKELRHLTPEEQIEPGDVFIEGGYPGHAVIVTDVAQNAVGDRVFSIAQSYMPAQSVHVLKNPEEPESTWYPLKIDDPLRTPEWEFSAGTLRRFPTNGCGSR